MPSPHRRPEMRITGRRASADHPAGPAHRVGQCRAGRPTASSGTVPAGSFRKPWPNLPFAAQLAPVRGVVPLDHAREQAAVPAVLDAAAHGAQRADALLDALVERHVLRRGQLLGQGADRAGRHALAAGDAGRVLPERHAERRGHERREAPVEVAEHADALHLEADPDAPAAQHALGRVARDEGVALVHGVRPPRRRGIASPWRRSRRPAPSAGIPSRRGSRTRGSARPRPGPPPRAACARSRRRSAGASAAPVTAGFVRGSARHVREIGGDGRAQVVLLREELHRPGRCLAREVAEHRARRVLAARDGPDGDVGAGQQVARGEHAGGRGGTGGTVGRQVAPRVHEAGER